MLKFCGKFIILLSLSALMSSAYANVNMPAIFADHMILQRNKPIPVWGWAKPNEKITVKFENQTVSTIANDKGEWQLVLKPISSSETPYTMIIVGQNVITIRDILIGEVWLCSGQSNMEFPVKFALNAKREISQANYPQIRQFYVFHKVSPEPNRKIGGKWQICSPRTVGNFTAVGYFFARELYQRLHVPIGILNASWGGTPAEAWTGWDAMNNNPKLAPLIKKFQIACQKYPENQKKYEKALAEWKKLSTQKKAKDKPMASRPRPPMGPRHFQRPSGLYNGMILSIAPYAIRGVIWYQGECNAGRAEEYKTLLPTLIKNWRDIWQEGNFPFYIVQIASWAGRNNRHKWAYIRQAQAITAKSTPNCGLVVTTDIGNSKSMHPKNKQEVARRLALLALAKTYGKKHIIYSGPVFKNAKREKNVIRISFDYADDGLVVKGNKLEGFEIAGIDYVYVPANARVEGNTVVIWSQNVKIPVAARYSWADYAVGNLYNNADLPAVPFEAKIPPPDNIKMTILNAIEDTYIDQANPLSNYGHKKALRIEIDEKTGKQRWALIKWDISQLPSQSIITSVAFRAIQIDGATGDGFDIYGITNGNWNETTVTWNQWQKQKPKTVFIGAMKVNPYPDGLSGFSGNKLRDWLISCRQKNVRYCSLLLKYHCKYLITGDTLCSREQTSLEPPQLFIYYKTDVKTKGYSK